MKKKSSDDAFQAYSPEFLVDAKGRRSHVLLKFEIFEDLLDDLHDLAVVAERRDDKRLSYDVFRKKLIQDGKLSA